MTALILDVESTGFREPEVIEAAWLAVEIDALDDPLMTRFLGRFKPSKPIELGAMATHHILDEDLANYPPSSDFRLPAGVEYLIGHQVSYDAKVVGWNGKTICTCALSRHFWPEASSHSLGAMLYHLHRAVAKERLKNAHSAADDVENCLLLLRTILKEMRSPACQPSSFCLPELTWEEVWQWSELARTPKKIGFGKHKGTLIAELPADYRRWLLEKCDQVKEDPYLERAVKDAL